MPEFRAGRLAPGELPHGPEAISAGWLNGVLGSRGLLTAGEVERVRVESIGDGQVGRVARVVPAYSRHTEAPASMIAKFPAESGPIHDLAQRLHLYEAEVGFYRDLASKPEAHAPAVYFVGADDVSNFVLLLEDLAPGQPGELVAGATFAEAEAVVQWLADLHARWWNSEELDGLGWIRSPDDEALLRQVDELAANAWRDFEARAGAYLPRSCRAIGRRLNGHGQLLAQLSQRPTTLVHGDLRINNVMFDNDGCGRRPRALIDWQTARRARPGIDLASLFVSSLSTPERRRAEEVLLPAYVRRLQSRGVAGYDLEQCWLDYRLAIVVQFGQVVVLSALLGSEGGRSTQQSQVTAGRLFAAIEDLGLDRLVAGPRPWQRLRERLRG